MFCPMRCYVAARVCAAVSATLAGLISADHEPDGYRGSSRRLRQDHTPASFVALVAASLAVAVLLISCLATHPDAAHDHAGQAIVSSRRRVRRATSA
jgi:hypothetical protein